MSRRERLLKRLEEMGADPKRSLGQNFLVSDTVVDRILFAVRTEKFSGLIEVGPGLGALTDDLVQLDPKMRAIELDSRFAEMWRSRGLEVTEADALQLDWKTLGLAEKTLFVSNLPYQISSSLVIERSLEPAGITRMILMFQKEVAQRIAARATTENYGLLTVIAQTFWDVSTVCEAGPRDFFPPPRVASRVLMFREKATPWLNEKGASRADFLRFAKGAFSHRRKLLAKNLQGSYLSNSKETSSRLGEVFATSGLLATARAEELDPQAFLGLYLKLARLKAEENG